jgi:hypothetical protein
MAQQIAGFQIRDAQILAKHLGIPVSTDYLYIDGSRNPVSEGYTPDGSFYKPFATVTTAIAALPAPSAITPILYLMPFDYNETVTLDAQGVILQGSYSNVFENLNILLTNSSVLFLNGLGLNSIGVTESILFVVDSRVQTINSGGSCWLFMQGDSSLIAQLTVIGDDTTFTSIGGQITAANFVGAGGITPNDITLFNTTTGQPEISSFLVDGTYGVIAYNCWMADTVINNVSGSAKGAFYNCLLHGITSNSTEAVILGQSAVIGTQSFSVPPSLRVGASYIQNDSNVDPSGSPSITDALNWLADNVGTWDKPGLYTYIDGTRTDIYTADGSISRPYKTIQEAVTATSSSLVGNTFYIFPDTYDETVTVTGSNTFNFVADTRGYAGGSSEGINITAMSLGGTPGGSAAYYGLSNLSIGTLTLASNESTPSNVNVATDNCIIGTLTQQYNTTLTTQNTTVSAYRVTSGAFRVNAIFFNSNILSTSATFTFATSASNVSFIGSTIQNIMVAGAGGSGLHHQATFMNCSISNMGSSSGDCWFTFSHCSVDGIGTVGSTPTIRLDNTNLTGAVNIASATVQYLSGTNYIANSSSVTGTTLSGALDWLNTNKSGVSASIEMVVDGGGSAITTGSKGFIKIPFAATITGWELVADVTGSIQLDVKKCTYAAYPTTSSIVGSNPPLISSGVKNTGDAATWTTAITDGDYIEFVVDSAATITKLTASILVSKV